MNSGHLSLEDARHDERNDRGIVLKHLIKKRVVNIFSYMCACLWVGEVVERVV